MSSYKDDNLELLKELVEPYGIKVKKVPYGEGGLILGNKKLSSEEAIKFLFGIFKEVCNNDI